jgi:hypothetical protein
LKNPFRRAVGNPFPTEFRQEGVPDGAIFGFFQQAQGGGTPNIMNIQIKRAHGDAPIHKYVFAVYLFFKNQFLELVD